MTNSNRAGLFASQLEIKQITFWYLNGKVREQVIITSILFYDLYTGRKEVQLRRKHPHAVKQDGVTPEVKHVVLI